MAIVIIDGFDHYPTETGADIRFHEVEGYQYGGSPEIQPSDRFGNQGKMLCSKGVGHEFRIFNQTWWSTNDTMHIGFALKFEDGVSDNYFIQFIGLDDPRYFQLRLYRSYLDGVLHLMRNVDTVLQSSINTLSSDTWYWIEIKVYIHASNGSCEVRVDGSSTDWINYGPGDTMPRVQDTPLAMIQLMGDQNQYNAALTYFDDLVIQDDDPTNTWLGDSRVTTLFPRTDDIVELSTYPNTGDDNAQFLNDEGLDGPSEDDYYVYTNTAGEEDIYNFDTIDNDDTIHALSLYYRSRKTNSAPRTVQSTVSATAQTGVTKELSTNYITYHDVFQYQDPSPGSEVDWTQTNIDASKFGLKVVS